MMDRNLLIGTLLLGIISYLYSSKLYKKYKDSDDFVNKNEIESWVYGSIAIIILSLIALFQLIFIESN